MKNTLLNCICFNYHCFRKFLLASGSASIDGNFEHMQVLSHSNLQVEYFPGTRNVRIGIAVDHLLVIVDLIENEGYVRLDIRDMYHIQDKEVEKIHVYVTPH